MSYDIDTFKLKKLENLVIPFSAFFLHPRKDWHPEGQFLDAETMLFRLEGGCGQTIKGNLIAGELHVKELDLSGEGSGAFMAYVMREAFKQSTGQLEAVLVWEGGDSISRLVVNNGEFSDDPIEL